MTGQECIDTQRIVSETYDGGIVDPGEIQRARIHCETCPECARFVSALAAVRRLHTPAAPKDAVDAAIQAVYEQKRIDDEAAAAEAAAATAVGPTGAGPIESGVTAAPAATGRWPKWAVYATWSAAAAATLIVAGMVTVQGARYIAGGEEPISEGEHRLVEDATAPSTGDAETDSGSLTESVATGVEYVTAGGWVYEQVGPSNVSRSAITTHGTTLTSLDTDDAPRTLDVYAFGRPDAILVDDDGQLIEFELVTRDSRGQTFGMQSRAITAYGQWPTLPNGIPEPSNPDGTPQFRRATTDSLGVQTYTLAGSDDQSRFAIAPDTDPADPAKGNPNWTWWSSVE